MSLLNQNASILVCLTHSDLLNVSLHSAQTDTYTTTLELADNFLLAEGARYLVQMLKANFTIQNLVTLTWFLLLLLGMALHEDLHNTSIFDMDVIRIHNKIRGVQ